MSLVQKNKDKMQRKALNTWYKTGCKGTLELCTGAGKTRIGILASAYFAKEANYDYKVLIIVPTVMIKYEWEKEFTKWKEKKVFDQCVQVECINTARDFKSSDFDLVIADEIHNYPVGDVNKKFFLNNKFDRILGLSATIDDKVEEALKSIAPICYSLSLYEAVELGLVTDFTIYNIPVELTPTERREYDELSRLIENIYRAYNQHSWKHISKRKEILYNAEAKMGMIDKLVRMFGRNSYGVIFSMTKDYANKVVDKLGDTCLPHHSGVTKKKRVEYLKRFADGRTKVRRLSSAKTLDEGVNLPRLQYSIMASNSSKVKQQNQRVGRCIRLGEDGKHAIIIRLYCKNTQEEKWVHTSQSKVNAVEVKNLEHLKKLLT